jgi:hypothetical protein
MTRPDSYPCACCARCGARLSRADHRRAKEFPLRVSPTGAVLQWGLACPVCAGLEPEAAPALSIEDLFA